MPENLKADTVRSYYRAFMSNDRQHVERLLTDDFTFTSPYDDAIGKTTYFERCWPNRDRIKALDPEKVFVQDGEAFVLYRCMTEDGKEFRNVEFLKFEGDRLSQVQVFFGATYRDGAFIREQ